MGNKCWTPQTAPVIESIQELQRVEKTLENLIQKYSKQIQEQKTLARRKMYDKHDCKRYLRTIQIIKQYKENMEKRLTNCLAKRYQLESLNVTKMHIRAVQRTTETFREFLNQNDIERVAQLQNTLCEMIDDVCEINETIQQPIDDIDDEQIEEEYNELYSELVMPVVPNHTPLNQNRDQNRDFEMVPLQTSRC